jgi:hypothetical protein
MIAVTGQDVGLPPRTDEEVRDLASGLVVETALPLLAGFALMMGSVSSSSHAETRADQVRAARALLPDPYRQRAVGYLEAGRRDTAFNQEQLLLAMRLVIEHGQPGPGQVDLGRLAQLLLSLTDIMLSAEESQATAEDIAVSAALRRLGLPRAEQPRYELARWYDLLATRARAADGAENSPDLDALFRARTGLAIEDFLGIAWFHAAPLRSPDSIRELTSSGFRTPLAQLHATKLLIGDVPALRARFGRDTVSLNRSSLRPFWEHPYVKLDSGRIVPVSSGLALNRGIRGVYHLLIDQAGLKGSTGVNGLTSFVGRLHEEYLTDLLRHALASGRHGTFVSEADVIAASGQPDKPPFDAAVIADGTLVLIEMLTATLRLATFERCDPALYQRDFDRDFKKKAAQLARAVEGVGDGTWKVPGAEPATVRRVVPVLASLHPFPLFGPMWNPFKSAFATPAFGHGATVMPLQLVTDEELEILEALQASGSMSIADALARRAGNPAWTESQMKHVILRAWNLAEPDNARMLTLYRAAASSISSAVAGVFDLVLPAGEGNPAGIVPDDAGLLAADKAQFSSASLIRRRLPRESPGLDEGTRKCSSLRFRLSRGTKGDMLSLWPRSWRSLRAAIRASGPTGAR